MSHLNNHGSNDKKSDGIKINAPREGELLPPPDRVKDIEALQVIDLETQIKQKDEAIVQLTAMCYTLARRLRNESFNDTIASVQRQQMAEMAMQSLQMTPAVWELVHRSEEKQQQNGSG